MVSVKLGNLSLGDDFVTIALFSLVQEPTSYFFNPVQGGSTSPSNIGLTAASVLPTLQCILQQNTLQRVISTTLKSCALLLPVANLFCILLGGINEANQVRGARIW